MGRCSNDALIAKISNKAVTKQTEVSFSVLTDVDRCVRVTASKHIATTGATTYNTYKVPEDMFNCLAEGCRNTGTLTLQGVGGPSVTYTVGYDATEYYAGLVTFYFYAPEAGSYTFSFTIADIANSTMSNADTYNQTITATGEGFYPVIIDFSQVPDAVVGNGWEASTAGARFSITDTTSGDDYVTNIGVSSFYFYDSVEDFEVNDVVKIGCIDGIEGALSISAADASCWGAAYDATSPALELTVTGRALTPNYWKLNPMVEKSTESEGWTIATDTREILSTTINGVTYGYIQVPDFYADECGFTTVAIDDQCNVTDAAMNRVNSPSIVALNERQFLVIDGKHTEEYTIGTILFNGSLVGLPVVVSYPKAAVVDKFVANDQVIGSRRVRMSIPVVQTDGVRVHKVFNNVLITSFPETLNTEETTFAFTISVQRDRNGNMFEFMRIKD